MLKIKVFSSNAPLVTCQMKHYRAKPSAQLSKYLQDDMKHAVMKLELE